MKKKNNNVLIKDKNKLFNELISVNSRLDMLRNGIFNLLSSLNYTNNIAINSSTIDNINIMVKEIELFLNSLIKQCNIRFGEKNENK